MWCRDSSVDVAMRSIEFDNDVEWSLRIIFKHVTGTCPRIAISWPQDKRQNKLGNPYAITNICVSTSVGRLTKSPRFNEVFYTKMVEVILSVLWKVKMIGKKTSLHHAIKDMYIFNPFLIGMFTSEDLMISSRPYCCFVWIVLRTIYAVYRWRVNRRQGSLRRGLGLKANSVLPKRPRKSISMAYTCQV